MKVNPILPSSPVQPVGRMQVTYTTLPVKVAKYEKTEDPAPDWLVALGLVSLVILAITAAVLWS